MSTKPEGSSYPYLEVQDPDGKAYSIYLKDIFENKPEQTRITIGRGNDNNIVLPDPHKKLSRHHCAIERDGDRWWLLDENSANGTFLRQQVGGSKVDVRDVDTILLQDGDVILMLGKLRTSQDPLMWELTFCDPNATDRVEKFQAPAQIEYHFSLQQLFKVSRKGRLEIKLSPQEQTLIHYMAEQSLCNNNQPVVCTHQKLSEAIWPDGFERENGGITRLVWSLRDKIEQDSGEPRFLKTVTKRGYLLDIRIQS